MKKQLKLKKRKRNITDNNTKCVQVQVAEKCSAD